MDNNAAGMKQQPSRYNKTARALHWLMAIPMIALLLFGEQTMGSHNARALPTLHASAGLVIIFMFCVRVFWRWEASASNCS
jgi:cytochrome b561